MVTAMMSRMIPAGDPERTRREVQQPGQQSAEDQQEDGDRGGGGQHLAEDAALGGLWHLLSGLEERHQRDLWPDADQEQQERVDDEGGVERFEVLHGCLLPSQIRWARDGRRIPRSTSGRCRTSVSPAASL
jgi:hypothetical protein